MATVGAAGVANAYCNVTGYAAAESVVNDSVKMDDAFVAVSAGFVNGAANQAFFKGGHGAGSAAVGGITTAVKYSARQFVYGQSEYQRTALVNFGAGAATGLIEGRFARPGKPCMNEWEFLRNGHMRNMLELQAKLRTASFGAFRSSVEYDVSSYFGTCISDPQHDWCPR